MPRGPETRPGRNKKGIGLADPLFSFGSPLVVSSPAYRGTAAAVRGATSRSGWLSAVHAMRNRRQMGDTSDTSHAGDTGDTGDTGE